ncbi:hypothetical protein CONPUDRAFT_153746 [Coniophora puteana RWD-64-598 SS2]|uniref:F-box domain-containing protein n=1 Tax=Coniophora puteana (strain RWD-64-598) TaxID=741705 RepID=A0A5M3MQ65_CONPW|nr:uncharacterized protein CONPUDRAFT_153746 [Coniophora puteana RWD-64-598 SS2]EIW81197.1 hypothetical protein CONPUDRAFT_153746 [Coniophora puteana RWD-64-598 SS2]
MSQAEKKNVLNRRSSKYWKWRKDPPALAALFPVGFASVSSYWRGVLSTEVAYWTRIIIFVDEPITSTFSPEYFSWSHDKLLDVRLTRRKRHHGRSHPDDAYERSRVEYIVTHLRPHLFRCRSIRLDLRNRSSVVGAVNHLRGAAPELQVLALRSEIADTTEDADGLQDLICPALTDLYVDPKTFIDVTRRGFTWPQKKDRSVNCNLSLGPYQPLDPLNVILAKDLVLSLQTPPASQTLNSILLRNIVFFPDLAIPQGLSIRIYYLTLDTIPGDFIVAVSEASSFEMVLNTITLKNCSVEEPLHFGANYHLNLETIADSGTLVNVLRYSDAKEVSITDCAGFDDGFLQAFGNGGPEGNDFLACHTKSLSIQGPKCKFSSAAFKHAVKYRPRATLESHPSDWWTDEDDWIGMLSGPVVPLNELDVFGCDTSFSPSQEEWFRQHIMDNGWSTSGCRITSLSLKAEHSESRINEEGDGTDDLDDLIDSLPESRRMPWDRSPVMFPSDQ